MTATKPDDFAQTVVVKDDTTGMEIFCEGSAGIAQFGGSVTISLFSPRRDAATGEIHRVIVARITMTAEQALPFSLTLTRAFRSMGLPEPVAPTVQ